MSQARHLTRTVLLSAVAVAALLLGSAPVVHGSTSPPPAPEYQPPSLEDVSEETLGHARVADGEGSLVAPGTERVIQIESPAHFLNTPFEAGDELDVWIVPPQGEDGTYFGTFEVPDVDLDDHYFTSLGPLVFPESAFEYSGIYAAVLTNNTGEVLVWQRTIVELEGDELDHENGPGAQDEWPIPEGVDGAEPPAPGLEDLTEDTYGLLAIDEEAPVLPLNRSFTAITQSTDAPLRYWLIPPDGTEALSLNASQQPSEAGTTAASLRIEQEQVPFTGIFALAGVDSQNTVVGWSPFGVSPDGRSIAAGDPGVNADNTATDRSIFPIPDSVPVPGEDDGEDPSPTASDSPDEEPTPTGAATAESPAEDSTTEPPAAAETEATSGVSATTIIGVGAAAVALIAAITAVALLIRRGSSPDQGHAGP